MTAGRPPRLAEWLLRRMLPPGVRGESILGDLVEDWRDAGETTAASLTYWRHALSLAARYALRRERPNPLDSAHRSERMFLDNFRADLRYAIRSYAKAPSFTLIILTTLALGIGASTAIFSMVNGILLQPLPLQDPDRLLYITEVNPRGTLMTVSWPNYLDWRARSRSFDLLACSREEAYTLTGTERAQRLNGRRVTGNFFRVLGVSPAIGREFTDDDDRPKTAALAIVSDAYWRTKLGADPSVVGQTIRLDDVAHTIVGVMPRDFQYIRPYDVFTSMGPSSGTGELLDRGNHNGFYALGRLKAGVTVESAANELRTIAAALEREYPNTNSGITVRANRLADRLVEDVRLTLLALFGAVGFLLLIACVNVANLLVARGAARQHELAVRAALGGGRARLASQLLVESTLISVAGGALGVAVAAWLLRALVAAAPEGIPRIADVRLDGPTLLFALIAAALCGIVFGALPAFQASGVGGQHALVRGRAAGFAARSHRLRRGLMVVETALALMLLAGAGLMMRTLHELTRVETGFKADHLLTTRFVLAGDQWTRDKRVVFFDDLQSRLRALPGVTNAAFAFSLPIDGSNWNSIFIVGDKPVPERAQLPSAAFTPVSAGYFETMEMRLVRGRVFDRTDSATSPKVTVDQRVAREATVAGRGRDRQTAQAGLAGEPEPVARGGRGRRRREVQWRHRRHADAVVPAARAGAVARRRDRRAHAGRPGGARTRDRGRGAAGEQGAAALRDADDGRHVRRFDRAPAAVDAGVRDVRSGRADAGVGRPLRRRRARRHRADARDRRAHRARRRAAPCGRHGDPPGALDGARRHGHWGRGRACAVAVDPEPAVRRHRDRSGDARRRDRRAVDRGAGGMLGAGVAGNASRSDQRAPRGIGDQEVQEIRRSTRSGLLVAQPFRLPVRDVTRYCRPPGLRYAEKMSTQRGGSEASAPFVVRQATPGDAEAVGRIWLTGWADGHVGNVPSGLVPHRQDPAQYLSRARDRVGSTWVAESAIGEILGFVVVKRDELEQVYVDRTARGTGVAAQLLRRGEDEVRRAGHSRAWLAVVAGNTRARAFYERQGWRDAGPFTYQAETEAGTFPVPSHRYEIDLNA